jgi:cytochrome P450
LSFLEYVRTARSDFVAGFEAAVFEQDIVEGRFLGRPSFVVNHPAGIKHVLLDNVANYPKADMERRILGPGLGNGLITSEGQTWRSHRRIMAPFFDQHSIQGYSLVMTDASRKLLDEWEPFSSGSEIEVSAAMMKLTLQIIARCMFSSDSDGLTRTVQDASERYQEAMMAGVMDFVPLLGPLRGYFKAVHGRRILHDFDEAIHRLIAQRTGQSRTHHDLLDRLIMAHDEETSTKMTTQEVRDQVFTIFVAGHETTALALTWTWYLLSQHPVEEARLHDELDEVLGERLPDYGDLPRLRYTRMVVQEALRLYPPIPALAWREPLHDDEICGVRIPRGSIVQIVPWVLHRHRRLWESPERFDPERFAPEKNGRDRFSYLPFSAGPRVCIGAAFAMTEAVLILASLAGRYRLRLAPGHLVETHAQITLRPRHGMKMILERR